MVKLSFKTGLDSNKFHAGLDEVRRHFEGNRDDAYLSGLLAEVEAANQALIGALNVKVAKQGINREAKELNERLASASRYIDSCRYVSDQAVRASAQVLKQRFSSEGKPFNHMKVDTRVGAVRVLLRDLATPVSVCCPIYPSALRASGRLWRLWRPVSLRSTRPTARPRCPVRCFP